VAAEIMNIPLFAQFFDGMVNARLSKEALLYTTEAGRDDVYPQKAAGPQGCPMIDGSGLSQSGRLPLRVDKTATAPTGKHRNQPDWEWQLRPRLDNTATT
jgi:hypothetical protein